MKAAITIEIDTDALASYTDEHLATLWHVAQANPADGFAAKQPGELVEHIGWEIIRRWLRGIEPEMHHQQATHYWRKQLRQVAKYEPGGPAGSTEWGDGQWVARSGEPTSSAETESPQ